MPSSCCHSPDRNRKAPFSLKSTPPWPSARHLEGDFKTDQALADDLKAGKVS
jgi:hypothetical protein